MGTSKLQIFFQVPLRHVLLFLLLLQLLLHTIQKLLALLPYLPLKRIAQKALLTLLTLLALLLLLDLRSDDCPNYLVVTRPEEPNIRLRVPFEVPVDYHGVAGLDFV